MTVEMWVEIAKDTFEKADFKSLNYLYQTLSWFPSDSNKPRYNILINTEEVENTHNFKTLSSIEVSLKDFLDEEFSYFVTLNSSNFPSHSKVTYKKNKTYFNIEEAIVFFNQPASIVLENNKNDSLFILSIIEHFGEIIGRNKAKEHFENGWLQFENAGGCSNIPNFMEGFLRQFKKMSTVNYRPLSEYFRGLIIIDSDKEYPTQTSKHEELIEKLIGIGIEPLQIHILKKRAMENYLPETVYQEIKRQLPQNNEPLVDWINTFENLTPEQKDYFNIADGFPPKKGKIDSIGNRKSVDHNILNFYSLSLSDVNFKKLDKGFDFQGFHSDGNLKKGSSFKDEFPHLFRKNIINKQNLEERDRQGELQLIVDKISKLL